jgi:hypothetical protein
MTAAQIATDNAVKVPDGRAFANIGITVAEASSRCDRQVIEQTPGP